METPVIITYGLMFNKTFIIMGVRFKSESHHDTMFSTDFQRIEDLLNSCVPACYGVSNGLLSRVFMSDGNDDVENKFHVDLFGDTCVCIPITYNELCDQLGKNRVDLKLGLLINPI